MRSIHCDFNLISSEFHSPAYKLFHLDSNQLSEWTGNLMEVVSNEKIISRFDVLRGDSFGIFETLVYAKEMRIIHPMLISCRVPISSTNSFYDQLCHCIFSFSEMFVTHIV